jgi:hypothetical protein
MQDAHPLSVGRLQPVAPETLMPPDGLEQAFGRHVIFVAQGIPGRLRLSPAGVKIFNRRKHCGLLLRRPCRKVKPAHVIGNAVSG